jgi:dipeptidyl aminopeptidase/acylaminoacyl peptidase
MVVWPGSGAGRLGVNRLWMWAVVLGAVGSARGQAPTSPSIEVFAARPKIEGVSISPDGRYLALIQTLHGRAAAVVLDRQTRDAGATKVVLGEPEHFQFAWCRWATNTRLLCSYRAMASMSGLVYGVTRLVAVDADGGHMRVLLQNDEAVQGQFQDRIINWDAGKPDTVLIEADEGLSPSERGAGVTVIGNVGTHALPAVFELNVVTGHLALRQHAREPIRHWTTDRRGQVRLGWGFSGTTVSYYARLDGDRDWRRLTNFEVFSRENHFEPIAISRDDPNKAYAIAPFEGRDAVWLMDLTDKEDPALVFAHPLVDVTDPIFANDGTLLGVQYETDYPLMYPTSERIRAIIEALKKVLPGKFNVVAASTRDDQVYVIRSVSDRDAPTYSVFDVRTAVLTRLGAPYPDLDPASLPPMQSITYPARDGTEIPGFLSVPPGGPTRHLPLIVMPHGGPIARDRWRYFFLRDFLVSRGYAVLQMNFRGSSGYGSDWFFAAHQDWGGLTYDDVVDGGRWAIKQGIADAARVCIVGWSFGGYLALVGAQRNPDLFRCAVSIAGLSDLGLLIDEGYRWLSAKVVQKQVGTDPAKLKRDSPRQHATDFKVPVLLLHGDRDAQAPYAQSEVMDTALTHAGKPHRFITIHDADHQLSAESDRVTMLREVEAFLVEHLGVAVPIPP